MSELKRHHINEVMDMHNLTKGEMGYSIVYYADDVDKVITEKDKQITELNQEIERLKKENEMTLVGVNLRSPTSDGRLV